MNDTLSGTVLRQLDQWRHYPKYQLERHVDVYFALWLPQVLQAHAGHAIDARLIPEFPIKKGLFAKAKGLETVNIDFLAVAEDLETAWFVELKTEMSQRRDEQDAALEAARDLGWETVLRGVLDVIQKHGSPDRDRKYRYLSDHLEELGLVTVPHDLNDHLFGAHRRTGLTKKLEAIKPTAACPKLNVVYVQPLPDPNKDAICFKFFAEELEKMGDRAASLFARNLRKWVLPAGSVPPGKSLGGLGEQDK